jgi:hypothetical protein
VNSIHTGRNPSASGRYVIPSSMAKPARTVIRLVRSWSVLPSRIRARPASAVGRVAEERPCSGCVPVECRYTCPANAMFDATLTRRRAVGVEVPDHR